MTRPQEYLQTYVNLFIERCAVCGRVLSAEDHVPPVARVWSWISDATGKEDGDAGESHGPQPRLTEGNNENKKISRTAQWEARHVSCLGM